MGKRIDELTQLDDREIAAVSGYERHGDEDTRDAPWHAFVAEINDLRESEQYTWAEETLAGISETVERTHRVTDGQRRAVTNIRDNSARRSRRYEGYTWRR